eukprot:TRINITY_DN112635_c0_g1_i1.p1 TRINITY_DN112635_c0_g1~~TRINITY_DN112635_c0_g1_i1.p1  ORF type:complete len:416 (+),score=114.40 TRINITY_DN112635_c0_g1_i1:182-1429(+)
MRLENFLGLFGNDKKGAGGIKNGEIISSNKLKTVDKNAEPSNKDGSPCSGLGSSGGIDRKPLSAQELDSTLTDLAQKVTTWKDGQGGFTLIKTMQEAVRNHGRVDLMEMPNGRKVAVKRMPTRWVRTGPREFKEQYPSASERPWYDFGLVHALNKKDFPYICELIGIFRDDANTFVVSGLATGGDLFGWCDTDPRPGKDREAIMKPVVGQICDAVRWIHTLGIAHRDISLENILLTEDSDGQSMIKLIDFGMGTLKRWCVREVRGKQSYQAPEMHKDAEYDAYLADAFAVGVVIYGMAVQDYPWISTKRGQCQLFEYVSGFGFRKLLERRKLRKGNGERLLEVMTPQIVDLLDGLLQLEHKERMAFGEPQWAAEEAKNGGKPRASVWDQDWLCEPGARRWPAALRQNEKDKAKGA